MEKNRWNMRLNEDAFNYRKDFRIGERALEV